MTANLESKATQAANALKAARTANTIAPPAAPPVPGPTSGLAGANAGTATPQSPPPQVNANMVNSQAQGLQSQGMGQAQAMNAAATNPTNSFAKGGVVDPPTPDQAASGSQAAAAANPAALKFYTDALKGATATKPMPQPKSSPTAPDSESSTEQMFKDYENKDYQDMRAKLVANPQHYAKGGDVHDSIKNMSLKDIIKLLATHPGLDGEGASATAPTGNDMKEGGAVAGQSDPDNGPKTRPGKANTHHGAGLLNMNADVGTYAEGGEVHMDTGGDLEADSIVNYGPDGTPIQQNANGTQQAVDINQLLDRPENAPTAGTGAAPQNTTTSSAGNAIGNVQAQNTQTPSTYLAKGGEDAPPPGSLSHEVADDVPAQLSEGEFVFSADAVRFYGLQKLTAMMDFARSELDRMAQKGDIRSPGDGKNPDDTAGKFMQDQKPNMDAYGSDEHQEPDGDEGDDMVSGLLKECTGGANMATGGGVSEENFAKGGPVPKNKETAQPKDYGRSNLVSSTPSAGSPQFDFAKGGIVGSTMASLAPKKNEGLIPSGIKLSTQGGAKGTGTENYGLKKLTVHAKKGGLLKKDYNGAINQDTHESYTGA